jgi:hypothetical protein
MNWINTPNEERLRLWKKFRFDINHLSLEAQLDEVAKFFQSMPIGHRSLDYYDPEGWPTPWEILFYGTFCTNSISLLMFHTLSMVGREPVLDLVDDSGDVYLLPIIDYQYILNYELGKVSSYPTLKDNFKILQSFSQEEIKLIT